MVHRPVLHRLFLVLCLILAGSRPISVIGAGRNTPPGFQAARPEFLRKFRSKKVADRLAALSGIESFPCREFAEILYQTALADESPEVRAATVALMHSWREHPEVVGSLLESLTRQTRKSGMDSHAYSVLQALGSTPHLELQGAILKYLDETLGTAKANQGMIHTLADDLGIQGDEDALQTLKLFTRARYANRNFGFRRCLYQGIVKIPGDETIDFLMEQLQELRGQVKFDVVQHLIKTTRQNFGGDSARWLGWWVENKRKLPKRSELVDPNQNQGRGYYGIPIGAARVVFILDISGSMSGRKLDAAKRELCDVIRALAPDVLFGVVTYARNVTPLHPTLVLADESNRRHAIQAVMGQKTGARTASYDAIEEAFRLDPEAIFFVSDGAPTSGKIVDPTEIVNVVSAENHVRRVSIHSIRIDNSDASGAVFSRFMRGLAGKNWGEYVEVD